MSDDAFSISDVESEGEGPNIRPPQASGSHGGKKSHKHKMKDRDVRRSRHKEHKSNQSRDTESRRSEYQRYRRYEKTDRDRSARRGESGDLRHRLKASLTGAMAGEQLPIVTS